MAGWILVLPRNPLRTFSLGQHEKGEELEVQGNSDFSKKFVVRCESTADAGRILSPAVMKILLETKDSAVEFGNGSVGVYRAPKVMEDFDIRDFKPEELSKKITLGQETVEAVRNS